MEIGTERLLLRTWRRGDELALVRNVNHRAVWRNVGDSIPHPYGPSDAAAFLSLVEREERTWHLAIVADGQPVGGVGLYRFAGLKRFTAEAGYWLGPEHWGRGFASEALAGLVEATFVMSDVERIEAHVFVWNPGSCRVLEKCGFQRDAVLRRASFKDGELVDELLYSRLRAEARQPLATTP
jgi:RimJ/RimL family protein N-acetyltransferase